eukprot:gnl/Chilomastix_caulleri/2337.p1 GENE.gnl/Chilomastix_caulleri/2337~~gnl/Chilomastix_caulleri/2337.p1  ORF type:complete len:67 (+),score=20.51 gnl/Chilomastix_caulleri/2337:1-201(+)
MTIPQAAGCNVVDLIREAKWKEEGEDKWVFMGELKGGEDSIMEQPDKVENIAERFAKILGSVGEMV